MKSKFEIITPASDLAVLSVEELRTAAGLAANDTSQDVALASLGLEAAEWVAELCGVRAAGSNPPTFLAEDVRETFANSLYRARRSDLILSRRFVTITSLTENGIALTEGTDFVVDDDGGIVERQMSGFPTCWLYGAIVIEYTAGFAGGSPNSVPAVLKSVMMDYVQLQNSNLSRDPAVRSETTVDLDSVTYFQNPAVNSGSSFEETARSKLSRFITGIGFV